MTLRRWLAPVAGIVGYALLLGLGLWWFLGAFGCGVSDAEAERIFENDWGYCVDNGRCGHHAKRIARAIDCTCELHGWDCSTLPLPQIEEIEPDARAWFFGECSWINCDGLYDSNLCKGAFWEPDLIVLPVTDDKALAHEIVHYVLYAMAGDGDPGHKDDAFLECGFPLLWCL